MKYLLAAVAIILVAMALASGPSVFRRTEPDGIAVKVTSGPNPYYQPEDKKPVEVRREGVLSIDSGGYFSLMTRTGSVRLLTSRSEAYRNLLDGMKKTVHVVGGELIEDTLTGGRFMVVERVIIIAPTPKEK